MDMELKGKKVLVVGLGKSGLAAALFLRRRGAQVTVSDLRSAEALAKEIPALLEAGNRGGSRRSWAADLSPPGPDRRQSRACRWIRRSWCRCSNFGLPVIGELELAARFLKGKTLAITGSNGKTTTTTLCGEISQAARTPDCRLAATSACRSSRWSIRVAAGWLVGARGFQLPAGDRRRVSSRDRGDSEHHA